MTPESFPFTFSTLTSLSSPTSKKGTDTSKQWPQFPLLSLNQNRLYQSAHSAATSCASTRLNAWWFAAAALLLMHRCLPQPAISITCDMHITAAFSHHKNNHCIHNSRLHSGNSGVIILLSSETWQRPQWCHSPPGSNLYQYTKYNSWQ